MNRQKVLPQLIGTGLILLFVVGCSAPAAAPNPLAAAPTPLPSTATPILVPPTLVGALATPAQAEADAWQKVQCLDTASLQVFLTAFPDGAKAGDAKLYLALVARLAEIKANRAKSSLVIPFDALGDRWQEWKKRLPERGGVGYFATASSAGIFMLPGCHGISMDARGMPITPTGDGSIAAFRTEGQKLQYLNSISMQSAAGDILHFGVIDGVGLVHLRGKGNVTMPDGKEVELQ